MPSSELQGSYPLTDAEIDTQVTQISAGAYALGYTKESTFYIGYVGRSDDDVNDRLKKHVGNYKRFKYGYFSSAKAAFGKECDLYHDFKPKDNKIHPARPNNSNWSCPRCAVFD